MKVLNKYVIQNLKLNKKRTIVTIIGIMLSTALICGVIGLVSSFQKTLVNMIINKIGNFHTIFYNVSEDNLKYIQNNINVEDSFLTSPIGFAKLENGQNKYKPYLAVYEYDEKALNNNGIELIEGRIPQNENEIIISEHIEKNARVKYNIGDKITLDIGKRMFENGTILNNDFVFEKTEELIDLVNKTHTIVGIMKRPDYSVEGFSAPGYTIITKMDRINKKANISVLFKNPKQYEEYVKKIEEVIGSNDNWTNSELLRYQGVISDGTMNALFGIALVVLVIIVSSSVFVIRNSFSISVAEKNRQHGMMSSIGATKKQIKKTVIFEGIIIGLIGIPLGIIAGIVAINILLQIVNYLLEDALMGMDFLYSLPIIPMLISAAISFLTIYLSCLIPARRASKISPIEAIRGNNDIKIKSKKLKTPKYIKKIFGIGGVIASKNLKRNKRKYITTVISIVISIVIFVSLSSFIYYGNVVSNVYYTKLSYNLIVNDSNNNIETYKKIATFNNIDNFSYKYESSSSIDPKYCTQFGTQYFETIEAEPGVSVHVYNNEYFKKYLKEIGISEEKYNQGAILIDDVLSYNEDGSKSLLNIYNVKNGDSIDLSLKGRTDNTVEVLKRETQKPMGLEGIYANGGLLIVSMDYIENIDDYILGELFIQSNNSNELENSINDYIKLETDFSGLRVTNYDKLVEMQNRMVLVISIFLYGFISVITLIGVTNIFNTITTNMILRSKEFAMLKSIGMTKKEFNKMIRLESILYGLKSLLIGLPIGILGSYAIYMSYAESVDVGYVLPIKAIIISVIFVFVIVGSTMQYSLNRINRQNIIDTIRNDNI